MSLENSSAIFSPLGEEGTVRGFLYALWNGRASACAMGQAVAGAAAPAARRRRRSFLALAVRPDILPTRRFIARSDVAFVFHAFALLFYVRTWLWHTTPAAASLPGSQGFGWFFR